MKSEIVKSRKKEKKTNLTVLSEGDANASVLSSHLDRQSGNVEIPKDIRAASLVISVVLIIPLIIISIHRPTGRWLIIPLTRPE